MKNKKQTEQQKALQGYPNNQNLSIILQAVL